MQTYLVGGAVRDKMLGRPVKERDWVVVGAAPEEMITQGFRPVGRDFPVFLHPETHEEYALARTERKTAPGYRGFAVYAAPDVTLEQDLERRDLTINAMAETPAGELIDPFGGHQDLEDRVLRHVSPAFAEDPVRILRVARFAARYAPLGFTVADATLALMRAMAANGEADALVPERVWQELIKALSEDAPAAFFVVLRDCRALAVLFPEIDALFGVPQPEKYHAEIDAGAHTLMVLAQAAKLSPDPRVRFAALTHDIGKGATPPNILPHHYGHEGRGARLVDALCDRLKAPKTYRELARQVARWHLHCHRAAELRPGTILKVLESLDAFRRPQRFEQFLTACEADFRGRSGNEDRPYPPAAILRRARTAAAQIDSQPFIEAGLQGPAIAQALRRERAAAIRRNSHL